MALVLPGSPDSKNVPPPPVPECCRHVTVATCVRAYDGVCVLTYLLPVELAEFAGGWEIYAQVCVGVEEGGGIGE